MRKFGNLNLKQTGCLRRRRRRRVLLSCSLIYELRGADREELQSQQPAKPRRSRWKEAEIHEAGRASLHGRVLVITETDLKTEYREQDSSAPCM
ncbi:hypothetical protein OJAV_G00074760 [Oryzias javanicus]|uniref:Uncharacterized protein n=1 Tax=Oryzias javanicus TaxID=123683 RepID=A0A437D2R7_ORYJA|nr:hypothetical protein OJAV_G00074760 [Oryzias javanicus]